MDVCDELIVAALAENQIAIWDLRKMGKPLNLRKSNLHKYHHRCVTIKPDKKVDIELGYKIILIILKTCL